MSLPDFEFSQAYRETHPCLPFGLAIACGVQHDRLALALEERRALALTEIKANCQGIRSVLDCYAKFFMAHRQRCPLVAQFEQVLEKGLPRVTPLVELLLMSEMSSGVLMGIQDLDGIAGKLVCDLAAAGDRFVGMRKPLVCNQDEIVLRDEKGIVASYFQGPDKRTAITAGTENVVLYGFFAPGVADDTVRFALERGTLAVHDSVRSTSVLICRPN